MEEKVTNHLRELLNDLADEIYLLCHRGGVQRILSESKKAQDSANINDYHEIFLTALNVFYDAGILTYNERRTWLKTENYIMKDGRKALACYYEGRDWYTE